MSAVNFVADGAIRR